MRVKDVMSPTIVGVSPDNSVRQAARIMLDHRVSGLPVVGGDGQLAGIISEGDLIRRTELGGALIASDPEPTEPAEERANAYVRRTSWKVGDAMTPDPITIDENASVSRAATLMQRHGIKRIPVTRDGALVGIVSRADLLQAIIAARPDGTASGDEAIQKSVTVRLLENTGLEALGLKVTVENGIVHLWGVVEASECKRAARTVAESVPGVKGVVEHFT
ncbi:CBS domain-containing protein [Mycoplana ramosa]|uniref:CBS domain-containing protein n=1 Tax=Mycoplana ramosa TaxID=40837 RepID=A0ABW3YSW0_MYCRA